jgi:hypothetical protein
MLGIPVVLGDVMWYMTLAAPAEWPMRVMLWGSPPNDSTFSRTHRRAKYWSSSPRFPLASRSSRQKNPGAEKGTVSPVQRFVLAVGTRVPGYTAEMYCASCEVRTEFIYVM